MLKLFPELNIQLCKSLADINKNTYLQSGQLICKDDRENIHEESINNGSSFLSNICGNEKTKKALQISATGHHHILLSGPVGTGKSLLARSLIHLLPNISAEEKLEIIKVQNLIPTNIKNLHIEEAHRPFREISRNTTITALTGNDYIPGEFSLANKGVLLFDELAEASPKIINQLREPIEQRYIVINRARSKVIYPTDFIFVGATNLCPCGKYGSKYNQCTCSINERRRYIQKISHAILNRIDLFCTLNEVNLNNSLSGLTFDYKAENMRVIKQIAAATAIQKNRYEAEIFKNNGQVPYEQFDKYCRLSVTAYKTINKAVEKLHLNGRDYVKTIRVARTIADLENTDTISEDQICEALSYRNYLFEN
jgi:magnesium chelatase family protein